MFLTKEQLIKRFFEKALYMIECTAICFVVGISISLIVIILS